MNVIYDSNVWVALMNTDDSCHKKACTQFQKDNESTAEFFIPECVLMEVITVLRRIGTAKHASSFIQLVAQDNQLHLQKHNTKTLREVYALVARGAHPKLSVTDLYLFLLSRRHTIVTYDTALKRAIAAYV